MVLIQIDADADALNIKMATLETEEEARRVLVTDAIGFDVLAQVQVAYADGTPVNLSQVGPQAREIFRECMLWAARERLGKPRRANLALLRRNIRLTGERAAA